MSVQQLFQAGRLDDAIQALNAEVRDNPTDAKRRTFLFELLCFSGDFVRAEKQLDILGTEGRNAEMGALLYRKKKERRNKSSRLTRDRQKQK